MEKKKGLDSVEYPDLFTPTFDEDVALNKTLHIPGFLLAHEDSDTCWCEPICTYAGDDDGFDVFTHRENQ